MKRIARKPLSILLCLIMLIVALPFHAFAAETYGGWCGEDAKWSYNADNNTLTISGKGKVEISGLESGYYYIWNDINDDLRQDYFRSGKTAKIKLIVNEGITEIDIDGSVKYTSIKLPNSLKRIYGFWFSEGPSTFPIPKSVQTIGCGSYGVSAFKVASENKNFSSKDGVLFSKDKSVLIKYPMTSKNKSYTIPSSVKRIACHAFLIDKKYLRKITVPSSVKTVEDGAFVFWNCSVNIYFKGTPSKMNYPVDDEEDATIYYPKSKKKKWEKWIKKWKKYYGSAVKTKSWKG